jgi:hypothetical protein
MQRFIAPVLAAGVVVAVVFVPGILASHLLPGLAR